LRKSYVIFVLHFRGRRADCRARLSIGTRGWKRTTRRRKRRVFLEYTPPPLTLPAEHRSDRKNALLLRGVLGFSADRRLIKNGEEFGKRFDEYDTRTGPGTNPTRFDATVFTVDVSVRLYK